MSDQTQETIDAATQANMEQPAPLTQSQMVDDLMRRMSTLEAEVAVLQNALTHNAPDNGGFAALKARFDHVVLRHSLQDKS